MLHVYNHILTFTELATFLHLLLSQILAIWGYKSIHIPLDTPMFEVFDPPLVPTRGLAGLTIE